MATYIEEEIINDSLRNLRANSSVKIARDGPVVTQEIPNGTACDIIVF